MNSKNAEMVKIAYKMIQTEKHGTKDKVTPNSFPLSL